MKHNKMTRWMTYSITMIAIFSLALVQANAMELTVSNDKEVSIEYTLRIEGTVGLKVIDSNVKDAPLTFIHGKKTILPALEKALVGMKIGEKTQVTLRPEEGYGLVNPTAIIEVKKDKIPKAALKVGTKLQAKQKNGVTKDIVVTEILEDTVILDSNHPLAGKNLYYEVTILDIKSLSSES